MEYPYPEVLIVDGLLRLLQQGLVDENVNWAGVFEFAPPNFDDAQACSFRTEKVSESVIVFW